MTGNIELAEKERPGQQNRKDPDSKSPVIMARERQKQNFRMIFKFVRSGQISALKAKIRKAQIEALKEKLDGALNE